MILVCWVSQGYICWGRGYSDRIKPDIRGFETQTHMYLYEDMQIGPLFPFSGSRSSLLSAEIILYSPIHQFLEFHDGPDQLPRPIFLTLALP